MSTKIKGTKAHQRYRTSDGTIVPGVTTITGLLNKPALVRWANQLGLQGIDSTKYVDKAAEIGTLAHAMVEEYLGGRPVDYEAYSADVRDQAENALISFFEWEKTHPLKAILLEEELVSDKYRYGGTIDCYAEMDGKRWLIDFKTGKGIYDEYGIQVSAYRELLRQHGYTVDGVRILRIGRDETEGFEDRVLGASYLNDCFRIFKHLLKVYYLRKKLKMR